MNYVGKRVRVTLEGVVEDVFTYGEGNIELHFVGGRYTTDCTEDNIEILSPEEPPVGSLVKVTYEDGKTMNYFARDKGWLNTTSGCTFTWDMVLSGTNDVEVLYDAG